MMKRPDSILRRVALAGFCFPLMLGVMQAQTSKGKFAAGLSDWKVEREKEEEWVECYRLEPKVQGQEREFTPVYLVTKPKGNGPFPALILNHGGNGTDVRTRDGLGLKTSRYGNFVTISFNLTHSLKDVLSSEEFQSKKFDPWKGPGTSEANIRRNRIAIEILESLDYVDKTKLCMWGYSGGGHLTLGFLAAANQKREIKAASIFSAGILPWWEVQRPFKLEFYVRSMSPSKEDTKNIMIPLLHIHGKLDAACIPEAAEALQKVMNECGNNSYKLVWLEDQGHGTSGAPGVWAQNIRFLRENLGLPEVPLNEAKLDAGAYGEAGKKNAKRRNRDNG